MKIDFSDNTTRIIVAIIGALGLIIAAFITGLFLLKAKTIMIYLTDIETKQGITGEVFIDANNTGKPSYPEKPAVIKLKRGKHFIRAESEGYESKIVLIENVDDSRIIEMKKITKEIETKLIPLSLVGWNPWGLSTGKGSKDNEIIVKGSLEDAGGFSNTTLSTALRGKTLVLFFSETDKSKFSLSRMVKLVYNKNDILLRPINESLLNGEYLPARDTPLDSGIEFLIPSDFDGKIGFVFYQANLNNLKITAYYK